MADEQVELSVPEAMAEDLQRLIAIGGNVVEQVITAAADLLPASTVQRYTRQLAHKLNMGFHNVYVVTRILSNLRLSQERSKLPPKNFLDKVTSSLEGLGAPWDLELLEKWRSVVPVLELALSSLTTDSNLMISTKFTRLTFARQNILHSSSIVTDLRPVFDEARNKIRGMIATQSLIIVYSAENNERRELHLTLDRLDVASLKEECERAELKAESIAQEMRGCDWHTIIYPEPDPS